MVGMATTSPAVAARCSSSQQLVRGVSRRPLLDSLHRSERDSAMATTVRCFPSGDGDSDLLSTMVSGCLPGGASPSLQWFFHVDDGGASDDLHHSTAAATRRFTSDDWVQPSRV
ncbi:hypothetical protein M6B38_386740 [Iris pallida]|uniref:Uncharacterized protein n=1 Tax=Iris pallida TaxID=29817 RepID=A0AAX6G2A6_IRIPA|nr:hypothetical protein M6B38_386740 [Iris pallida]